MPSALPLAASPHRETVHSGGSRERERCPVCAAQQVQKIGASASRQKRGRYRNPKTETTFSSSQNDLKARALSEVILLEASVHFLRRSDMASAEIEEGGISDVVNPLFEAQLAGRPSISTSSFSSPAKAPSRGVSVVPVDEATLAEATPERARPREASPPRSSLRLRRSIIAEVPTGKPGYLTGNTALDLVILLLAFLCEALLFAAHCTPLFEAMVGVRNAREWLGVRLPVQILAGMLLAPAMVLTLAGIVKITCLRHRTVRQAQLADEAQEVLDAKSLFMTAVNYVMYLVGPGNSYFFVVMFLLEAKEFLVQALAVDQMSRAGVGREALTLYVLVMLLNGLAPLGMAWASRRINRIDESHGLLRRAEGSKWISRLLLFDATCDLLYSFFAVVHLLFRYILLNGGGASSAVTEIRIATRFAALSHSGRGLRSSLDSDVRTMKALMLLSEATSALYGGGGFTIIFVKFASRGLPLLQAPLRVMAAFSIRQSMTVATNHRQTLSALRIPPATDLEPISEEQEDGEQTASWKVGRSGSFSRESSSVRRCIVASVKRTAFKEHYKVVPQLATGSLFVVVLGFCLTVFIRLWSWGDCPISEIEQSCAVRSFPLFASSGNEDDWNCRSCSCNTLFYATENCTGLAAMNHSAATAELGSSTSKCNDGGHRQRYAGEVLNLSGAILQSTVTIYVGVCPSDKNLLQTLSSRADQPVVMRIQFLDDERIGPAVVADQYGSDALSAVVRAATHEPAAVHVFPPAFGYRRTSGPDGSINTDDVWPLKQLEVINRDMRRRKRNTRNIKIAGLPSGMWEMSSLRSLRFQSTRLGHLPVAVGRLLSLQELLLKDNQLTSLPSSLGQLTDLNTVEVTDNSLSSIPTTLGLLTKLYKLNFDNNFLSSIPSSAGLLTQLETLGVGSNSITVLPSSMGLLTGLTELGLGKNLIVSINSATIGKLTNLQTVSLDGNLLPGTPLLGKLTALTDLRLTGNLISILIPSYMPASLKKLYLDRNLITGALPFSLGKLTALEELELQHNFITEASSLEQISNLRRVQLQNNSLTTLSLVASHRASSPPENVLLNVEGNNISRAEMDSTFTAISNISSSSSSASGESPPLLVLLGRNPGCASNNSNGYLSSRVIGPWRIECKPECSFDCQETGAGDDRLISWINDGRCDVRCDNAACGWDGGGSGGDCYA